MENSTLSLLSLINLHPLWATLVPPPSTSTEPRKVVKYIYLELVANFVEFVADFMLSTKVFLVRSV